MLLEAPDHHYWALTSYEREFPYHSIPSTLIPLEVADFHGFLVNYVGGAHQNIFIECDFLHLHFLLQSSINIIKENEFADGSSAKAEPLH